MIVLVSNQKGEPMSFVGLQSMILIGGNIALFVMVLCFIRIFSEGKKEITRYLTILWALLWILLMLNFIGQQTTFSIIIKNLATIVYLVGLVSLCGLLLALRRFKHIYPIVYDFLIFLKSRVILPKKNVEHTFKAIQLLETYINLITKYVIRLEFIKTQKNSKQIKDKYLNYVLNFSTYGGVYCMFNEIFVNEIYKFNAPKINPKIIDCGSNIGLSILYFKALYPQSEIIGFEPGPETFDLLRKNIEDNNLKNVVIHNNALADKNGDVTFYVCKENSAHGGWSVGNGENMDFQKVAQPIPCVKLSEYVNEPIDFLKIDIEGAENQVIDDLAKNKKLTFIKLIILEYHHHMIDSMQDDLSNLLKNLEDSDFGYQFNFVEKPTPENKMRNTLILNAYNKKYLLNNVIN
jgi:FkbM family methyltransferase